VADLRVAIVTPTLNQARYIAETIESVLAQDYPLVDYVVVDGGSGDGTEKVLKRYGPRVRSVVHPGQGQSAAINEGFRMVSGDVLAWLNSDDTYRPGALRRAVDVFRERPGVDVVYGECALVDGEGRTLRPYPVKEDAFPRVLRSAVNSIPQPATFLRRGAFEKVGGLDESLHYALDLDLWLRLGAAGSSFQHLKEPLATLRLHGEAKSVRETDKVAPELVSIFERLFARPDLPAPLRSLAGEAMSNAHYLASACLFWAGHLGEARTHAFRAVALSPLNLRPQLLLATFGRPALWALERLWGNPFRQGLRG
jgi:hypothetical protein